MSEVTRLIHDRARRQGAEIAYRIGADGRALTWMAVAEHADRLDALAAERRLPARTRIGLVVDDPLAFTATYLGTLAAGLTAVPIDPRLTAAELAATAARLRVDVLVSDTPDRPVETGAELWDAEKPSLVRPAARGPRPGGTVAMRPAVLLTSSGTTGTPKGIGLTDWQLLDAARRVARHHRFGPGERGYNPLPLFHVNAQVMGLLATLVSGASLVLERRFDPDAYWERVARWRPTWLNAVPAVLAALLARPAPAAGVVAGIRFARSASAPLPVATLRDFAAHTGVRVLETYGMTEAAGQITANPLDPDRRKPGSVGLPVGVGLAVLGPDGRPAGPGEQGMVALRGRQVAAHYLVLDANGAETRRPARTADGWLLTGDLGTRDADGFVYLDGRADDVINRGGEKIFPQEIEDVLLMHPAVRSAAVVGAPHERLGQVPVAFVTAIAPEGTLVNELHAFCERLLARHKRPAVIEIVASLPTGPTGKVLRRRLRAALPAGGPR